MGQADLSALVEELRELIVQAAPDTAQAAPVLSCGENEKLDELIPFSSLIVLGTVVAIEDRFSLRITRQTLAKALADGVSLASLAAMVAELQEATD